MENENEGEVDVIADTNRWRQEGELLKEALTEQRKAFVEKIAEIDEALAAWGASPIKEEKPFYASDAHIGVWDTPHGGGKSARAREAITTFLRNNPNSTTASILVCVAKLDPALDKGTVYSSINKLYASKQIKATGSKMTRRYRLK